VLTAALALVALPGLGGTRAPSSIEPIPASASQSFSNTATTTRSTVSIGGLDAAYAAAGTVGVNARFIEPGTAPKTGPTHRAKHGQPDPTSTAVRKPPRYTLTGVATFYNNGTTAMRLPRGTVIIVCGAGGCVQRVVNDYGPQSTARIIDLYEPDFFDICGCPSFSGTTKVTVSVY
jgi:hypothetical protein